MKGVSGILGGVVVVILLLLAISLTLAAMNYAYGVQQIEAKTIMSQLSQPHAAQVSPDSVMTSGRLVASYIIYPDGRVTLLNETVSGIKSFQSYLGGRPWAIVVFSNGQWINVTNVQFPGNGHSVLGTDLVPYYPDPIDPQNATQIAQLLQNGLRYNLPIIINNTLMYGYGRILAVPVTSGSGWLNFTVTGLGSNRYNNYLAFAILVPNATGNVVAIYVTSYSEVLYYNGVLKNGSWYYIPVYSSQLGYGIHQFDALDYKPFFGDFMNLTYNFVTNLNNSVQLIKVAIKFSAGQPAQMYIWAGYYNGSGISWYRVPLPSIKAPVGSLIGYSIPIEYWSYTYGTSIYGGRTVIPVYQGTSWSTTWNMAYTWPVNIYSEYVNTSSTHGSFVFNGYFGWWVKGYDIYGEPLTPKLGSYILVVPYWYNSYYVTGSTAIFNVTYSI